MKKFFSVFLVLSLLFSPVGAFIFQDEPTVVAAKRYSSGKKGFNMNVNRNVNQNQNPSMFQQKRSEQQQKASVNRPDATQQKGGFMRGLMLGGLAGLLFGGLLASMGLLGSFIGLAINILAIVVLIVLVGKIFELLKSKKKKEDPNPWNS